MPKHKTKFVNALDLELETIVQLGGNDYYVTGLSFNDETKVIVVLLPCGYIGLSCRQRNSHELRLIVPQHTPFPVLK